MDHGLGDLVLATEEDGGVLRLERLETGIRRIAHDILTAAWHMLSTDEPYRQAQRVFVIVDNGSAHRGKRSIDRLQSAWPNLVLVHTPIHASWLNQAEISFSVVQRKVVTPNDFADLDTLEEHLLAFGRRYQQIAAPFQWKFTRHDLLKLLAKTVSAAQPATLAA